MKKPKIWEFNEYINEKLDKISNAGGFFGNFLGKYGRIIAKILLAVLVLLIFGIAVFIWSMFSGIKKKK